MGSHLAKLTKEQKAFLDRVGVPLSRVFDASGMRTAEYKQAMRDLGMWVAYGASPCEAEGHTLRSRTGHCVQCKDFAELEPIQMKWFPGIAD